ncbi:MAG: RNA polymerase sigma factor [bacterium]|nr:RNA polymerase sigma factor [bacterium]
MNEHRDDLALRDRILDGDREAAEALFRAHADTLFEFVYYRVGMDRTICEDVVQETLLVAFDKLGDFDGRSSLHTWMCGIAKNRIRTGRRKRQPVAIEDLLHETDAEIDAVLADVEREPLPEDVLEARETRELVGAALSSLPPNYRRALADKYLEGLSVPETARREGVGVKAAESTLHRAKQAFGRVFALLAKRRGEAT